MPSDLPRVPLRIEEDLKLKFEYIAFKNGRSMNKETRQLLLRHIEAFEKRFGEIKFEHYCDYLDRPVVAENGNCFLRGRCKCDTCQQRGGPNNYLRER